MSHGATMSYSMSTVPTGSPGPRFPSSGGTRAHHPLGAPHPVGGLGGIHRIKITVPFLKDLS